MIDSRLKIRSAEKKMMRDAGTSGSHSAMPQVPVIVIHSFRDRSDWNYRDQRLDYLGHLDHKVINMFSINATIACMNLPRVRCPARTVHYRMFNIVFARSKQSVRLEAAAWVAEWLGGGVVARLTVIAVIVRLRDCGDLNWWWNA